MASYFPNGCQMKNEKYYLNSSFNGRQPDPVGMVQNQNTKLEQI